MDRRKVGIVAMLAIVAVAREARAAGPPSPELGRYKAHVATLASAEFAGRWGPGAARAAAYVHRELRASGLQPVFRGEFVQEIPNDATGGILGRNVAAKIVGTDPTLRDEWIIVAAHYDHLGRAARGYFPGADDNASGVAMMLEVARCFAQAETKPKRSIMFIGFDLEEEGLWGSRFFVDNPPVPLDKVKLFVTADMIGRELAGVCKDFVFAFGSETSPGMKGLLDAASRDEPVRLGMIGNDLLMVDRSDYGPFRKMSIPYLFFSTGENPHYHRQTDTSDTLDYAKALATTRIIHRVLRHAGNADAMPPWNGKTEPSLEEAIAVRDVMRDLHTHRAKLGLGPTPVFVLQTSLSTLEAIIARGRITPQERNRLVMATRILLTTVL